MRVRAHAIALLACPSPQIDASVRSKSEPWLSIARLLRMMFNKKRQILGMSDA